MPTEDLDGYWDDKKWDLEESLKIEDYGFVEKNKIPDKLKGKDIIYNRVSEISDQES